MQVGFVGLGNMGLPMAKNLVAKGISVAGYDLAEGARAALGEAGGRAAGTAPEAVAEADAVVTALPAARHVRGLLIEDGLFSAAPEGTLFIDCSTIDVATARALAVAAQSAGRSYLDCPMSGGVGGAEAGTLSFMVGGEAADFARAEPVLAAMGRNIFHAGGPGAGAAAKICNNLMLAIQMIAVSEGFNLAEKLGLEAQKLYDISSTATARCWSLNDYCPAPGPQPKAPSNRDYAPGFAAELMLKDLRLAMEAVEATGVSSPLGAAATQLYALMALRGQADRDFSGIIRLLRGEG
ncbi:MAG: 3-hydroxyisobutyrate dehydrogenase [Paracoccaceae bacterium]